MDLKALETLIDSAFEDRDNIGFDTHGEIRDGVNAALALLDNGQARVAEPTGNHQWQVNQWLKKAVLLSFRLNDVQIMDGDVIRRIGECGGFHSPARRQARCHLIAILDCLHEQAPILRGQSRRTTQSHRLAARYQRRA